MSRDAQAVAADRSLMMTLESIELRYLIYTEVHFKSYEQLSQYYYLY